MQRFHLDLKRLQFRNYGIHKETGYKINTNENKIINY